ncbi:DUF4215 domain-containing protein [Patescibacteria group bacterium]
MRKLTTILFLFLFTVLNIRSVHAAVSDCATFGCFAYMTDAGDVYLVFDNGTGAGTITGVGTGQGVISASEGYLIISRDNSNDVWLYDVETETACSRNIGNSGSIGVVFGNFAYVTTGSDVKKIALDCTSHVSITVGSVPVGITKDNTTIYVLNQVSADISTIVPPAETATTQGIGRQMTDWLSVIKYHQGNNVLYMSSAAGIYEVPLPLSGTSSLFQALPEQIGDIKITQTHIATGGTNVGYLIPISAPATYSSFSCTSCRAVALNHETIYSVGGFTPDVGVRAWDFSVTERTYSPHTTNTSWGTDYLLSTLNPPVCPNGTKETGEECDGTQFGSETCITQGFDGGSLACSGTCIIDTSGCFECGDGTQNTGEDCDTNDLNNQTCISQGFDGGTLACDAGCNFDSSACTMATCGDSNIDAGEDCDGANLGSATCQTEGFVGGTLACTPGSCQFDTSGCTMCGNGAIDAGEQCDGANLNGASCVTQGFDSGSLSCDGSCTFNTSACTMSSCGNGVLDSGEECDDGNSTSGDGCSNQCQVQIDWECDNSEPSNCTPLCGNGTIDGDEECDGANLNGATCTSQGHGDGTLSCTTICTFNTSQCSSCNEDGLVTVVGDQLDRTKLADHNLNLYTDHLNVLTKESGFSCETVSMGDQEVPSIAVSVSAGAYENVRIKIGDKEAMCQFFAETSDAKFFVNISNPKKILVEAVTGAGVICTEDGANIEVQVQGALLAALGTGLSARKVNQRPNPLNPTQHITGNFLELYVSDATVRVLEWANQGNQVVVGLPEMWDGPLYIDLDAFGDLSEILNRRPQPPKEGCPGCSEAGGTPTWPAIIPVLLIMMWVRRFRAHETTPIR